MLTNGESMKNDDLDRSISELAGEIAKLRENGPASVQEIQRVASLVTRAQLSLGELERVELRQRGLSRDMAERFAALEGRIRELRDQIYGEMKGRKPAEGRAG